MFDIERLRKDVALGTRPLRITTHAQKEAFKDGLLLTDLRYVFDNGETVEIYPQEKRSLCLQHLQRLIYPFTLWSKIRRQKVL